jgi:hypothetical protein
MSESDEEKPRRPWGCAAAAMVLLPVLYILGIGPAAWLYHHSPPAVQTALEFVYMPLPIIVRFTVLVDALRSYVEWWTS